MIYRKLLRFFMVITFCTSSVSIAKNNDSLNQILSQPITIALSTESYPYHFWDENNQASGVMVDFWLLWAERQNVEVKFVKYTWVDSLNAVEKGDVHIHAGMAIVDKRKERFNFTDPIYLHKGQMYLHREMTRLTSTAELTPYAVGAVKGSSHIAILEQQNPEINIRLYANRYAMFDGALRGEVLAFASVDTLEKDYENLQKLMEQFPNYQRFTYYEGGFAASVNKKNVDFLAFVNEGIAKITEEERYHFYQKWTSVMRDTDKLNVVFTSNLSPYMGLSPSGTAQGLFIDIWKLWSEITGIELKFIPETMAGSINLVNRQQADVHLAYPEAATSASGLSIASHVYGAQAQIFVARKAGNILTVEGLSGKNIGMFGTSPYKREFEEKYPAINVLTFNSHAEMIQAAEQGQIDAIITEIENMNVKLVNANLQSYFYLLPEPVYKIDLFSLVHPTNPQLSKIIAEGFKLMPLEELQLLERNWLSIPSNGYFSQQAKKLDLTAEEYSFLMKKNHFVVGISSDWAPIEFVNDKGEADGINKDILLALAERAGLQLEFKMYDNYDSLFKAFEQREVDIVSGLSDVNKSKTVFSFTDSYWDMHWAIMHSRFLETQQSIKHFYGKQLAMVKGYHLIPEVRSAHPQINIMIVDNVEQGLIAVQQGIVDGFVESLPVLSKLASRESVTPMAISVVEEIPLESNKIGVHKSNEILAHILNKALLALDEDKRQGIFDKWFDIKVQTGLEKRFVAKIAAQVGILIFIVIFVIAIWNRKLHQEVKLRKSLEEKMKHMATHDELTGLANRVLLKQQMSKAISMHQRQHLKLAVLFVDLDGFKKVNDSYGHESGDNVLIQVAKRIEGCVRNSDTVARFGGDEFVVMITGLHSKEEAIYIAEKIIKAIGEPFQIGQNIAQVGCSIGIAVYPDDGHLESDILNMADHLMYRVKTSGKNNYTLR